MTIYESDLPGVGKKYEVELQGGERLVVVTHNTGKREVFKKPTPDADGEKLFTLSDRLARQVGTILEGAYFQPVKSDRVETMLSGETAMEWYSLDRGSAVAGEKLGDTNVRERTGASVIAIQRDEEVIASPGPNERLEAGDTLVVIGDREDCLAFESLISGNGGE